jgi:hypothetical protein
MHSLGVVSRLVTQIVHELRPGSGHLIDCARSSAPAARPRMSHTVFAAHGPGSPATARALGVEMMYWLVEATSCGLSRVSPQRLLDDVTADAITRHRPLSRTYTSANHDFARRDARGGRPAMEGQR